MKIKSATLRTFTTLHTWVGLVAGFALFVAFYAGAITVLHHELQVWQSPHAADRPQQTLDDAQRLLDETLQRHPEARKHVGMLFPGEESPHSVIYWQNAKGTWLFATLDDLQGSEKPPQAALSELVNALHYSLGIPVAGTYLMGIVSLLYGVALFSGLVIHLPKLVPDLFALRPGRFHFLGPSENVTQQSRLFAVVDSKRRIFRSTPSVAPLLQAGEGISARSAVPKTSSSSVPAASTNEGSCVREPAWSIAAVREVEEPIAKLPLAPAAMLPTPNASRSRSGLVG